MNYTWGDVQIIAVEKMFLNNVPVVVSDLPDMREDIQKLVEISVKEKKYAYLLINNRVEGCAPLTIDEIYKIMNQN